MSGSRFDTDELRPLVCVSWGTCIRVWKRKCIWESFARVAVRCARERLLKNSKQLSSGGWAKLMGHRKRFRVRDGNTMGGLSWIRDSMWRRIYKSCDSLSVASALKMLLEDSGAPFLFTPNKSIRYASQIYVFAFVVTVSTFVAISS